jgi:hypothetical protein
MVTLVVTPAPSHVERGGKRLADTEARANPTSGSPVYHSRLWQPSAPLPPLASRCALHLWHVDFLIPPPAPAVQRLAGSAPTSAALTAKVAAGIPMARLAYVEARRQRQRLHWASEPYLHLWQRLWEWERDVIPDDCVIVCVCFELWMCQFAQLVDPRVFPYC